MQDKDLISGQAIQGVTYDVALMGGKVVLSVSLSGKVLLDMLAAKIGGPMPIEIAKFLEDSIGLT